MIEVKELNEESQEMMDLELFEDPYLDFEYKEAPELSEYEELFGLSPCSLSH